MLDAALVYTVQKDVRRCLQVDDEVRRRWFDTQLFVDTLIQLELVAVEIYPREQRILLDKEIGHPGFGENVALAQVVDFLRALKQEKELGGERSVALVAIETFEERVLVSLLQQHGVAKGCRQAARQGGFTNADRPLNGNVARWRAALQVDAGGGGVCAQSPGSRVSCK